MPAPLLLHAFSTFAVGGAQVRFATIANHFGPRWRHMVVAMDGNLACRERLDPGLDVQFPDIPIRKGNTLHNARALRGVLRTVRPAALVTSNWGTIEWAIANRRALAHHVHTEDGFGPEERARQIPRRVWTRRAALAGRAVVVPSRTLYRIATQVWRLSPSRVHYIPNGVKLSRFQPGPAEAWPGVGPVVGTVSALRAEKNLPRLLHAFAAAVHECPARLVIVGDGPERPRLEQEAARLGIAERVHFAGHRADPAPVLRGLDVFAMSSDTEQMPISLLEAMAAGLPVAATDVGDIAAMLPDEQQGFVVPLDHHALGYAIQRLAGDPALRLRLGAANRARAEAEFSQQRMLDAWAYLYDEGLHQESRPSPVAQEPRLAHSLGE